MYHHQRWNPESLEEFGKYYSTHTVEETAKKFGIAVKTCYFMASKYGFSKKYVTAIWDDGDDYLVVGLDVERVRRKVIADKMDKTERQVNNFILCLKRSGKYYTLLSQYIADNNHKFKG